MDAVFSKPAVLLIICISVLGLVWGLCSFIFRISARDIRNMGKAATTQPILVALRPVIERLAYLSGLIPQSGNRRWLWKKLSQADLSMDWTPELIQTVKLGLAIFSVPAGAMFFLLLGMDISWMLLLVFALSAWFTPDLMIASRANERTENMRKALPFVIDLIAVSSEAGLAFQQAIANVIENTKRSTSGDDNTIGPILREFEKILANISVGMSMQDAMTEVIKTNDMAEFKSFASAIIQAEKLGSPISGCLKQQSEELRNKLADRIEVKANQAPVKIIFPLILFIFPVTTWVILGPILIKLFFS